WPVAERLKHRIIDGERDGLETDLAEQLETMTPLEIVNDVLLDGMKVVGELFGSGQMQLPFVLQSAETMKAAVAYLEPMMEKADADHARQTRGAEHAWAGRSGAGAARRRRPDPHLRGARPARGLRRTRVLRQGRVRRPAHHGRARPGPA